MIIGIDGNEANVEKKVGISEYAFELLKCFSASSFKFIIYLKNSPRKELPEETNRWRYRVVKPGALWTQLGLPFDLYSHKPRPDVFFTPTHYSPRFSPIPTVMSVMDLSYVHYPELFNRSDLFQLMNWTSYSVRNAKKVFTISQSSKNDIIKIYNVSDNKVLVTYPGIKTTVQKTDLTMKDLEQKYGISNEFILFVGTLQPRKNITKLIEAYSKLYAKEQFRKKKIQLIVIGKKGWQYESILSTPEKLGVEKQVKFLEFVDDDELSVFYKNALCFVLPSLYEGFGLPVLEAMKNDCPVITSNVSSLPEAGGDAALYIDPLNVDSIADTIEEVVNDPKLRTELIKKGQEHIKKFNWEKTAKETLKVLEEVAKKNER